MKPAQQQAEHTTDKKQKQQPSINDLQNEIKVLKETLKKQTTRMKNSKTLCDNLRVLRADGTRKIESLEDEVDKLNEEVRKGKLDCKRRGEEVKRMKLKEEKDRERIQSLRDQVSALLLLVLLICALTTHSTILHHHPPINFFFICSS